MALLMRSEGGRSVGDELIDSGGVLNRRHGPCQ